MSIVGNTDKGINKNWLIVINLHQEMNMRSQSNGTQNSIL